MRAGSRERRRSGRFPSGNGGEGWVPPQRPPLERCKGRPASRRAVPRVGRARAAAVEEGCLPEVCAVILGIHLHKSSDSVDLGA
jgi:hypothetical protein